MLNQVPVIHEQPSVVNDNATHYGYCAFADISISDRQVQPSTSPYYHKLPARQLLPFVRIDAKDYIGEVTQEIDAQTKTPDGRDLTVKTYSKTARECIDDVATSYAGWGFTALPELTGMNEQDAFWVVQTIQPFPYKLKDIEAGIAAGYDRIERTENYTVGYEGEVLELNPLPDHLRVIARRVAARIEGAAKIAYNYALEIKNDTQQKMETFFAGGDGKRVADPRDRYVFSELGVEIPTLINREETKAQGKDDSFAALAEALKSISSPAQPTEEIEKLKAELAAEVAEARAIKEDWSKRFKEKFAKKGEPATAA